MTSPSDRSDISRYLKHQRLRTSSFTLAEVHSEGSEADSVRCVNVHDVSTSRVCDTIHTETKHLYMYSTVTSFFQCFANDDKSYDAKEC